jgi:SEC-C motif
MRKIEQTYRDIHDFEAGGMIVHGSKIGRNMPCPCDSGKKYKHCHGSVSAPSPVVRSELPADAWLQQMLARNNAENSQREQQQGMGNPIISVEANGYRIVGVGNRVFYSLKWKTFHDFLRDYPALLFGEPWMAKQRRKAPVERHPYLQWMQRAFDDQKRLATKTLGEITTGPVTAAISSVMSLAYNLYLIHHNLPASNKTDRLCQRLIKRLKLTEHFWGALYETYAFALFAVAGFTMELEDESDGSVTHCEFSAGGKSGRTYSVECKGRNRETMPVNLDGSLRIDDQTLGLTKKLSDALSKRAAHERVVFLDLDLPMITSIEQLNAVSDFVVPKLYELEGTLQINGKAAPSAYVFVTNTPDHRNVGDNSYGLQAFAVGFKIRDFGQGAMHHGMHELMKSRERHADILSLKEAAKIRHMIPSTFDGSNPAFAFSGDQMPRLRIGDWYMVPDEQGVENEAQLCSGIVLEDRKIAYCVYRTRDGANIIYTNTLTDDEINAYRLHPKTFFGVVDNNVRPKVETVVDWFDFFFESYQDTPKEKLLEFLANVPDHDELANQSQRDLAITYCERMALRVQSQGAAGKAV